MHGHCLCESIEFEIDSDLPKLYQCHCSLCRRQGGSASNTATIVSSDKFRWIRGAELISSWRKPTGFRSDFCMRCGSPVPNPLRGLPYVWVPAGLLDAPGPLEIVAHIFVDSKAPWDVLPPGGVHFPDAPSVAELTSLLAADT